MTVKARVVPGFLSTSGKQVSVWCRSCCGWHHHGCAGNYGAPGDVLHRVSHCPADRDGYGRIEISRVPATVMYSLMYKASPAQREVIRSGRTTPSIERLRAQDVRLMERGALQGKDDTE